MTIGRIHDALLRRDKLYKQYVRQLRQLLALATSMKHTREQYQALEADVAGMQEQVRKQARFN